MSILKRLREESNLSLEELASSLKVPVKEIKAWEKNSTQISKSSLSSFANHFGLSSEDILDAEDNNSSLLPTNHYHLFSNRITDGFWGHLGIQLKNHKYSKWFPITIGARNQVSDFLLNLEDDDWLIVETLNNRVLAFRPAVISKLSLLDDGQDQPENDWKINHDEYSGFSGEFYKGLEAHYLSKMNIVLDENEEVSELVKNETDLYTDKYDLNEDEVKKLVTDSHIYDLTGNISSQEVDDPDLVEIIRNIELEDPPSIYKLSTDDIDLFIPRDNISLLDMP